MNSQSCTSTESDIKSFAGNINDINSNQTIYLNILQQFQQELENNNPDENDSLTKNGNFTQGIVPNFVDLIIAIAGKFPSMTPCVISLLASIISAKINPDCVNHFACRLICNILGFSNELEVKMMPFIAQNLSICCKAVAGMLFNDPNSTQFSNLNLETNDGNLIFQSFDQIQKKYAESPANPVESSKSRTPPNPPVKSTNRSSKEKCTNCGVDKTTLWRRGPDNELVCNACGLYFRLHRVKRPISMKQGIIRTRRRRINEANANSAAQNNNTNSSTLASSYHNKSNGSNGSPANSESDSHSEFNLPLNLSISPIPQNHFEGIDHNLFS